MTIHDRMLSVYKSVIPDKIPIGIYNRYLPRGTAEREARNMGLGIIDYFPVVTMMAPPWHMSNGFLSEVRNVELNIKYYWDKGERVERRTYSTPVGEVYQDVSRNAGGVGSEHIRKYYIDSIEDYKIMQYIVENTIYKSNENAINIRRQDLGDDGIVLGRIDRNPYQKCLIELAGAQKFLIDLYTDKSIVVELLKTMDEKMDEAFDIILDSHVEVLWQPDNVTADLTPPDNFKEYCLPFYQKHSKQAKVCGKPYVVHMDGKIKALKNHIQEAGFDVIESLSFPQIGGDMTLTEAREAFNDIVIIPNLPSNLCNLNNDEVEQYLDDLIIEAARKPFMLQISEDIPWDHWKRIVKVFAHKFETV